jgi:iron complex outermembrane recepter protein
MSHIPRRKKLSYLIHAIVATSMALPLVAQAQTASRIPQQEVEEVVVTGSYIRNSAFAQKSPVDTVTQADLFESGAPSMGAYIRDLSYTQNTNAVFVVLGSADGAQDGINSSFNLRGLGENSTLTLVDGARTLNPAMQTALPEIAIGRMEVVLDGGSALYGSDAVAGVVNLIPIKDFQGLRARTYYQTTEDHGMEEMNTSLLWGKSFDNGIDYVGAVEFKNVTPLMMYERTREWQHSNNASNSGPTGTFRALVGSDPGINLLAPHGGTVTAPTLLDPSCGTFNEGSPDHGQGRLAQPSGTVRNAGKSNVSCTYEYSMQHPYRRQETDYNLYNTVSYEATDWLRLNATLNNHYRNNEWRSTGSSPNGGNDRAVMKVPANHPANPWGVDLVPYSWRVFGNVGPNPSSYAPDSSKEGTSDYALNRVKFQADYDITGSWTGYTYYATQDDKYTSDETVISSSRLQLAMSGQGGPGGNEWFNPFGSRDPRSPYYVEGVTSMSQGLVDWLMLTNPNSLSSRNHLDVFETLVTGEVYDLPAGPLQMAFGYQWRDVEQEVFEDSFDFLGEDYANSQILGERQLDAVYQSETQSYFMELQIPILENLDAQIAVRNEEFTDFGLETTTPKISLRWEALPTLALRASWGESFLAPTPYQSRPFVADDTCADMYSGIDEFTNTLLIGGIWCRSGNPNLKPETSTIKNIGFTWQPNGMLDGLNLSMDYQEIEYTDRIRTLSQQDTVGFQFSQFLAATGVSEAGYDPTPGSATRAQADAWLAQQAAVPGNPIQRYDNGSVSRLFAQAANVSSVFIDLVDIKAQYRIETENWGSFTTTVQTTVYGGYDYQGLDGVLKEALGKQNGRTGIVPPIPEVKGNVRMNWFRGKQSASISANWWSDIDFDDQVVDLYAYDGLNSDNPPSTIYGEYIVDARYAQVFDQFFDSEFTVSAGINNLFNKQPQRLGIIGGFESRLSTNWGRQFWVSLDWTPGS